ncbi:glycoside hydrolase family 3 C-terminal domain-containing protein [Nocardiopsis sp. CNS-639]|uniref:glycoside hydrolase family 3 C-terminal domain-containing protein n=1 Tax=Nocardiopsis sp. CNS-639 TaxID=1169153 RepID=UPI000363EE7E|nr:glycoside hydrolase family 3 C-terminal domain-containing protein [Nocardiopsis sp. CNS-639]
MSDRMGDNGEAPLTLGQKAALLSGRDTWTTQPLDGADGRAIRLSDGPHGLRAQEGSGDALGFQPSLPATCFPPAVAVGSSWDAEIARRVGEALGREARSLGIDIVLGPGVNIKRSPLCGRNFEYYSEDPLLSGVLGAGYVRGLQSAGVGASVKHFAANNQETDRMRVSAEVDERTLRELYLPAFERVVKDARPATVMCSYNKVNGVRASQNHWLLTRVLRDEWGFEGAVVSDWGAVHDPVAAVKAGLDLEMPGTNGRSAAQVAAALADGTLDEEAVDRGIARIRGLDRFGRSDVEPIDPDAQHEIAREAAAAGIVLLKNDGSLPLAPDTSLAVIGELARTPRYQGGGSSHVLPTRVDSFLDAACRHIGAEPVFAPGYPLDGDGDAEALRDEAVRAARTSEVAVVFAGLRESDESEGFDRASIDLPPDQVELIRAVASAARRTVVVLSHGGVVSLEGWHDDADAIVDGFLLGQAGGSALADVLFGRVNPSGRLAETIPLRIEDTPSYANFPGEQGHVVYGERLLVGYRGHATFGTPVRYPFGHGLSYTEFRTRDHRVTPVGADAVDVAFAVDNVGDREGAYVAQVYVDASAHRNVRRPARSLGAFTKVVVPAGGTSEIRLRLDRRAFSYWDVELHDWVITAGSYGIVVGRDALNAEWETAVTLEGDEPTRALTLESTLQEWAEHPLVGPRLADTVSSDLLHASLQPDALRLLGSLPMQKVVNLLAGTVSHETWGHLMAMTAPEGSRK